MYYTPLRYPGGKTKFVPYINSALEKNGLIGCDYYEAYAGGAGVAFSLLFGGRCKSISINDADHAVYAFWKAVVEQTGDLIKMIENTPINMDVWHQQKDIFQNPSRSTLLEIAFSTFFLNRTNRSGILKAGVIGGKNQTGKYKLDARFNKFALIERIIAIGKMSDRISVHNQDALDFIDDVDSKRDGNSFMYLDPPYYVKGEGLYRNFYTHSDHVEVKDKLAGVGFPWLVSYDDNEEIHDIYKDYKKETYVLNYSAQKKMKGSEVIIFSDNLDMPTPDE